jgi:hypothetical protein
MIMENRFFAPEEQYVYRNTIFIDPHAPEEHDVVL